MKKCWHDTKVKDTDSPSSTTDRDNGRPRFSLRFSERRILLAAVDSLALVLAMWFSLRLSGATSDILFLSNQWRFTWLPVLIVLWFLVAFFFDVYDLAKAANAFVSVWLSSAAAAVTALLYYLIPYITPPLPERRLSLILFPMLAALGVGAWRFFYATVFVQPVFHHTALVVGAGASGQTLARAIAETHTTKGAESHNVGYRLLGFVDDDPSKQGREIAGVSVLGTSKDLGRLVRELHPTELVIAITHAQSIREEMFQAILDCQEMGIPVTTMTSLYERLTGRVPVEYAGRDWHVVFSLDRPSAYRLYLAFRRLLDVLLAVVGMMGVLFLVPLIWLGNQFTSPGPIFYRQTRVGKGGVCFEILKFRSMIVDAERLSGAVWAEEADPRVTPVGRILRKARLDELPQVWNVFKGEMSLIGPRPERPEFVQHLAQEIPFYRARHAVKPGITGWAQVKYPYGASVEDALIKLQYDLYYIKHQSLMLDLLILLRTIQVMLGFRGR